MTYNFDPYKWHDDQLFMLKDKLRKSELTQDEFDEAVADLEEKHEEMWQRLDGTYQINHPDS